MVAGLGRVRRCVTGVLGKGCVSLIGWDGARVVGLYLDGYGR